MQGSNRTVKLGNQKDIKISGEGSILINKVVKGQWERSILKNVLYVPELKRNLFSEGQATRRGYVIVKNKDMALIKKDNEVVMCARLKDNNLYELDITTIVQEDCNWVQTDIKVWHERLGHLNVKEVMNMSRMGTIPTALSGNESFMCEACQYGKQTRLPFKKSHRGPSQPGDLVYSDICGPLEQASVSGKRYFVLFKDGATSYRHVYFLKQKSEVLDCFIKYNAIVNNLFQHNVRILHTDNGREYVNNEFKCFLEKKGIIHECTAPYTPQQNARAERELRTIMESARSMLYAKGISLNMWAEAVNCATYLLNRSSSSQTSNMTPYELWNNNKASLQHIRIFGSTGYVHIPKEKTKKLDKRSVKMTLVGYDEENYRMYDQNTRKITISRDVRFDEDSTPKEKKSVAQIFAYEEEQPLVRNNSHIEDRIEVLDDNVQSIEGIDKKHPSPNLVARNIINEDRMILRSQTSKDVQVNLSELNIPNNYEEAVNGIYNCEWKKAIAEELQSHEDNNTWVLTKRTAKKPITCKWVFSVKKNKGEIVKFKARLCARGFTQVKDVDYKETFSPTTRYDSVRLLLSVAAKEDFEIMQFDVKTAFLYGELKEEIYMEVPEGVDANSSKVCKLNKSLYGLKQSSRCWNKKFCSFLTAYGFKPCESDNCVFVGYFNNVKVLLIIYVDDGLLLSKDKNILIEILSYLKLNFNMTILKCNSFMGMDIEKSKGCIIINQKYYVESIIDKFNLSEAKNNSTPVDVNVQLRKDIDENLCKFPYREAVGALLFLSIVSRPDISYAVNLVSRYVNNPNNAHINAVKRIIRYLKGTKSMSIVYNSNSELIGYSDSDFAGDLDTRKSNTGYIFLMNGGPVTWASRKQNTVALSTTESEYMAASDAAKEILWLKQFLSDINEPQESVILNVDNMSAIKLVQNPVFHKRSKHIDVRYNFIRTKVEEKLIDIRYIESACQLADFLTKALSTSKFVHNRDQIMKIVS